MKTPSFETLREFLIDSGLDEIGHHRGSLLDHCLGVREILRKWECSETAQRAGLFHSWYGTPTFLRFSYSEARRRDLRPRIGENAEQLVYAYCAATGKSVWRVLTDQERDLWDRFQDRPLHLPPERFDELLWIQLADRLDQRLGLPDPGTPTERIRPDVYWETAIRRLGPRSEKAWRSVYG